MNQKAIEIAKKSLKLCYLDGMIIASTERYRDYWARDTFFALPGLVKLGDSDIAKNCINGFLKFQNKKGKIPRKILRNKPFFIYIFNKHVRYNKVMPVYDGIIPGFRSIDGNALLVIASGKYLEETRDIDFIKTIYKKLLQAINWYRINKKTGYIHNYFLSDWMDSVFKFGPVLYTNVLYTRAMKAMKDIANALGEKTDEEFFERHYEEMKRRINKEFWNGEFFSNRCNKKSNRFDEAGNVIACFYDIANKEHKLLVAKKLVEIGKGKKLPPAVFPKYPFWRVNPLVLFMFFGDYHSSSSWLWIDLLAVLVLAQNNQKEYSDKLCNAIEEIAIRDKLIGETYFCDGREYKKKFWKSVKPFAWSSGIFLEIYM